MRFSQRMGLQNVREAIQVNSIDDDLRVSLWNVVHTVIWEHDDGLRQMGLPALGGGPTQFELWARSVFIDVWKMPLSSIPPNESTALKAIESDFMRLEWWEAYDLIEHTAESLEGHMRARFISDCNLVLEREMAGYRLVGTEVTPITDEQELSAIEEALEVPDAFAPARAHLACALAHMSDREAPDYRNSIKESISAVEGICRILLEDPTVTLGKALPEVTNRYRLHGALGRAFSNLYGYTSDSGGIRHSLSEGDEVTPSFEDAKFILVACSAFVNYLIAKSSDA